MNAKKKATLGGARPGAGRPKLYEDGQNVTYRFPQKLIDQIEEARGERSANAVVVERLTESFKTKGKAKKGE